MSGDVNSAAPVDGVAVLLRGDVELRAEIRRLRRRVRELEASRDQWRSEARGWKWSAMKARG